MQKNVFVDGLFEINGKATPRKGALCIPWIPYPGSTQLIMELDTNVQNLNERE